MKTILLVLACICTTLQAQDIIQEGQNPNVEDVWVASQKEKDGTVKVWALGTLSQSEGGTFTLMGNKKSPDPLQDDFDAPGGFCIIIPAGIPKEVLAQKIGLALQIEGNRIDKGSMTAEKVEAAGN